jgi:succinate dehydrogenase / fumarate reductase cytochrome b subunit
MFQSLGISHPVYTPWIKRAAKAAAILIAIGNISIPVAVLAGLIQPV